MTNITPTRPAWREPVYSVIDGERDYQDAGQGNAAPHAGSNRQNGTLSPGEGLQCIEEIAAQARAAWYKPDGGQAMLPFIRKIAGVAVQLMENYGAIPREGHDPNSGLIPLDESQAEAAADTAATKVEAAPDTGE